MTLVELGTVEEQIVLNVSQSEAGIAHDDHVFVQSE
jgi:hypothetical protein